MELPEEIINIIVSMRHKDSEQKSPIAMLIKNSQEGFNEYWLTSRKINGMNILRSNSFYFLRCEILKQYHMHKLMRC